jgi:UDP-3-O-[3-hydroxymyristoyl] glucosamine N-acyltransferase
MRQFLAVHLPPRCQKRRRFSLRTYLKRFPDIDGDCVEFEDLDRRLHAPEDLSPQDWQRHGNGRGWVEKTATVASTAFVGPNAIVLGNAQVLDQACITGEAIVTAGAIVAGAAYVGGRARIGGLAKISGTARILGDARVAGYAVIAEGEVTRDEFRPRDVQAQKAWRKARLVR